MLSPGQEGYKHRLSVVWLPGTAHSTALSSISLGGPQRLYNQEAQAGRPAHTSGHLHLWLTFLASISNGTRWGGENRKNLSQFGNSGSLFSCLVEWTLNKTVSLPTGQGRRRRTQQRRRGMARRTQRNKDQNQFFLKKGVEDTNNVW